MIEAKQVLNTAKRSRQQPRHHSHRRADAEGNVDAWLP